MQLFPIEQNSRNQEYMASRSILTEAHSAITNAQLGLSFSDVLQNHDTYQEDYSSQASNDALYLQQYYAQQNAQAKYNDEQARVRAENDEQSLEDELDEKARDKAAAAQIAQEMISEFNKSAYNVEKNSSLDESDSLDKKFISPYSMYDSEQSTEEIRFTKKEVDSLIESMMKEGYTNTDALNALKKAGDSFAGATPEDLMKASMQALMGEGATLTKREEQALLALSQKLANADLTGEDILTKLTSSSPENALNTLQDLLSAKEEISISKTEMSALSSLMQISDDEKTKLMKLFGESDKVQLNSKDFEAVFASSRQEIRNKQAEVLELANTLSDNLQSLESDARKRIEFEMSTQNKEDKLTSQTKQQMENSILNDVIDSFDKSALKNELLANEVKLVQANINEKESAQKLTNEQIDTVLNAKAEQVREVLNFQSNSSPSSFVDSLKSAVSLTRNGQENLPNNNKEGKQGKESFEFLANAMQNNTSSAAKTATASNVNTKFEQAFVSSQLSTNIATAAKNNVTKLEVRLNPVELGAVNVVLTAKDGELRALIQPEKEETMHTINQQIAAIKRELESQGVKLESIEVEMRPDEQNSFANAENSMQEEGREHGQSNSQEHMQAELDDLNRLRVLGRGINEGWLPQDALSEDEYELAQNLLQEDYNDGIEKNILTNESYINILA